MALKAMELVTIVKNLDVELKRRGMRLEPWVTQTLSGQVPNEGPSDENEWPGQ